MGMGLSVVHDSGQNKLARLNMRELKEVAQVFIESGSFTDVKQAAQAMVKIMAGAELGFSPIVSMTGVHFFNGKVSLGAGLIASLIKSGGKYEYKITEHTETRCSVQFYQVINGELKSLGVAVTYTWADAQKAGLTGKDNWKKYPKDMLFASCIRQGARRYCADILRGVTPETDVESESDVVPELQSDRVPEPITIDGEIVDTATGEIIEEPAASTPKASAASSRTETDTTPAGAVQKAVDLAKRLNSEFEIDYESLVMQFLPEGVAKFGALTEEQAVEILPGIEELLKTKMGVGS